MKTLLMLNLPCLTNKSRYVATYVSSPDTNAAILTTAETWECQVLSI